MNTIPKLLTHLAETRSDSPATRIKALGLWETRTWKETESEVRQIAGGLADLGIAKGEAVIVFGNNTPALYASITACQVVGALPTPVHGGLSGESLAHALNSTNAKYIVAQDQQQVDATLAVKDQLKQPLQKIIYTVDRGLRHYELDNLLSLDELKVKGGLYNIDHPAFFDDAVRAGRPEDIAMLLFSSGVDRKPCPVKITYSNMLSVADYVAAEYEVSRNDEVFAFVPISLSQNLLFGYTLAHTKGLRVNFPEGQETVIENLAEISPTILYAPSYAYKQIMAMIHQRIGVAKGLLSKMYGSCMNDPIRKKSSSMLGSLLVTGPVQDLYGLAKLRVALTGGDIINKDVFHFFRVLGIDLRQVYGMPETFGCLTMQTKANDADHVGHAIRNMELKFSDKNEVLCRGSAVSPGYFNDEESTKEAFVDGWYHTGDVGELDADGRLRVYDKLSSITQTLDGQTYIPKVIENTLKASPYIKEICIIGGESGKLVALVIAEQSSVETWANSHDVRYTGFSDLVSRERVQDLIAREIQIRNQMMEKNDYAVKYFLLLHRSFLPEIGELTWTNKLRRSTIIKNFGALIDAIKNGQSTFKFSDMASNNEEISLDIHEVGKV